jgi:dTDP-4-amino-4,6-dideoxygalactose transaminase
MDIPSHSLYLIPDLPPADAILPFLQRMEEARWYSNFGPLVCEFETKLHALMSAHERQTQARAIHLTTVSSGYHALELGLRVLGLHRGQRVLMPAVTFTACPLAVEHAELEGVLADIDPATWTLTPTIARSAAQHMDIAAVMPVAIYGVPLPTSEWDEFSEDTGIPVLLDAAAAFGTQHLLHRGLVAFSLHATKPLGIGEGGILAGRDPDLIARARRYSNFGMIDRISQVDGTNAKMSEYHAAVGLAQISRWTQIKGRRKELFDLYRQYLEPLRGTLSLQPSIETAVASLLMLLLREPIAHNVLTDARESGLALHQTYLPPLYSHPYFAHLTVVNMHGAAIDEGAKVAMRKENMVNSENLFKRLIGVPFHSFMNEQDVALVVKNLDSLLSF